jgi:hypothetical protein
MRVAHAADRVNAVQQRIARARALEDTCVQRVNARAARSRGATAL